jgi:hypothetical protein
MANENEMKIIFGADTSPLRSEVSKGADVVEEFGDKVDKTADRAARSFDRLKKSTKGLPQAFDEVAAGAEALKRINKRIDEIADAALKAGKPLENFGRAPLKNLADLDKQLRTIKATLNSGFKSEIGKINLSPQNFSNLARSADQLNAANNRLKSTSSAAAFALNDIGRVAQDVPFGFIGIQNNLNPLLESFRRLKAETGSTGGALKALAASIGGVGGLGLALSLVSSAFLIYQNGISGFNRKTSEAKDEFKSFLASLRDSKRITDDATASVQEEILKVQTLTSVILDNNRSNAERTRALDQLKTLNKEYYGDLKLEAGSLATLTAATNEYTKALTQQAIAKGFADEISKVSSELFKQERILKDVAKGFTEAQNAANQKTNARAASLGETRSEFAKRETRKQTDALNEQVKTVGDLRTTLSELSRGYSDALQKGLEFKNLSGPADPKQKKEIDLLKQRKEVLEQIVALERQGLDDKDIQVTDASLELKNLEIKLIQRDFKGTEEEKKRLIQMMFPDFDGENITYTKPIVLTAPLTFKPIVESIASDPLGDNIGKSFENKFPQLIKKYQADAEAAKKSILAPILQLNAEMNSALANAFLGLGDALAEGLGGGNPVEAFLSTISTALEQLGKAMIAFAVAQKLALSALFSGPQGWAVALAAGVAALAAGKLIRNQLTKTQKFAEGGIVRGPTLGMVGEAGPEMIIPLSRANQFVENNSGGFIASTEIRGQDLLLLLQRAMGSQGRRGGNF